MHRPRHPPTIWWKAQHYFRKTVAPVLKRRWTAPDDAPLEIYGIDLDPGDALTNELEKSFGSLSKTLFFRLGEPSTSPAIFWRCIAIG